MRIENGSLEAETFSFNIKRPVKLLFLQVECQNAIEASAAASEVIVVLSQRRSASGAIGYEISVEDQAGGLDQTILNSFGRPQVSTKGGEHQGLGLKIVVDLCQELEIDLEVLSTTRGTQFRLVLALSDENTQLNH